MLASMCKRGSGTESANADNAIEVTPLMIKAGASELSRYNSDFEGPEDAVCPIYEAMRETHLASAGRRVFGSDVDCKDDS